MPIAEFIAVTLDCAEPPRLAAFYRELTGGEVTHSADAYAAVEIKGAVTVYFQQVAEHRPPTWPTTERPQQSHLDFYVADLDEAEAFAVAAGATRAEFQPDAAKYRVVLDPAGHPLCLCRRG